MAKSALSKHKAADSVKWFITFLAILLLATGVTAMLTKGFTTFDPYGWFSKTYSFKVEMPELMADELPKDSNSPYTLLYSYHDGQTVKLTYTTDNSTTAEYTLTVTKGVTEEDITAVGLGTVTYKYVIKGGDLATGKWLKLTDGTTADESFTDKTPGEFVFEFKADKTIKPVDSLFEKLLDKVIE